jgi:hypothetical protein
MRLACFICLAMLAVADLGASQEPKKRDDRPVISVIGCVDGSWLDVRKTDPIGSYATRYKLRGAKQLMKELEKLSRRLVDVTGRVTDASNTQHLGKTIEAGKKTRVRVGAKDVPVVPSGDAPSLEVESFQELKESCK